MDLNGKNNDSINYLVENYSLIHLLEKEPLRHLYAERLVATLYKDCVEASSGPTWEAALNNNNLSDVNSIMLMRLKLGSLTQQRDEDAMNINKL